MVKPDRRTDSPPRAKKRDAARSSAKAPAAAAVPALPELPHDRLLADLQERCDQLRHWHEQATAQYAVRDAEVEACLQQVADDRAALGADRDRLTAAAAELAAARQQLAADRGTLENERKAFAAEGRELEDARGQLSRERDALTEEQATCADEQEAIVRTRAELDEEWTSVCRLRRANDKLADELDAERQRQRGRTLRLSDAQAA